MPGWLTLAQLPWGTLLKQAAAALATANELRTQSQRQPGDVSASSDVEVLRKRIDELERHDRATADLIQQLANQTSALALAARATAVKARQAFVIAIAAVTVGVLALLVVWLR